MLNAYMQMLGLAKLDTPKIKRPLIAIIKIIRVSYALSYFNEARIKFRFIQPILIWKET